MAKRKRHSTHSRRRRSRRRVGASGLSLGKGGTGMKLLSIAAGYFMAETINAQVDKVVPKTTDPTTLVQTPNQNIAIIGEVGLGGLLLMKKVGSGTASTVLKFGGGVLLGAGLKRALKKFGVIKGYQSVPVIGRPKMAGYQSVPVIGKTSVPPQLAGRPAQLQGYRVNGYTPHGSGVMSGTGSGLAVNSGSGYMS